MAACSNGISADLLNDCLYKPVAGVEVEVIVMNRTDIATVTKDNSNLHNVKGITLKAGKKAYKFTGFKKSVNGGHELVVSENAPDMFKQTLSLVTWGIDVTTVKALDNLGDLVAIVETKNKGIDGDGAFEILGLETGLHKTADSRKFQENLGNRTIEMATLDDAPASVSYHVFFDTSYATTAAEVAALLVQVPLT